MSRLKLTKSSKRSPKAAIGKNRGDMEIIERLVRIEETAKHIGEALDEHRETDNSNFEKVNEKLDCRIEQDLHWQRTFDNRITDLLSKITIDDEVKKAIERQNKLSGAKIGAIIGGIATGIIGVLYTIFSSGVVH